MKEPSTRQQKIDFLEALQQGRANIKQLFSLPIYGMVILEEDGYHLSDGQVMSENEFETFLFPYKGGEPFTICGMIIK
ncbi:MAG: hypothetical protein ABJB11_19720 [Ferruginibacter sp.]